MSKRLAMSVIAKFRCQSNENGSISLWPVYDPNPESENGKFFAATPGGNIQLSVVNETAAQQFEVGQEYYVTFKKASQG